MQPRISVIILNWNGRKWLENCLSSILKQELDEDFEVLLVDNGSTDSSVEYVKNDFPEVRVVDLERNYGFAQGNNLGVSHARGEYLIFVNMDTKAEDGWLKNLVMAADEHLEYQILCSMQLPIQEKNKVWTLYAVGAPAISPYESTFTITDSLFASGACFLVRRNWLEKLAYLFDSYYFCYSEDIELSLRTILLGGRIGYVRDSRINHYSHGSEPLVFWAQRLSARNLLLTYYKLFTPKNFARVFIVYVICVVTALIFHFKRAALGLLKGILDFLSSFRRYEKYRKWFLTVKQREDEYVFRRFLYIGRLDRTLFKKIYSRPERGRL